MTALRWEVASLRAQVASLEAERDEYAQQNAELFVLQQVLSTINSTLDVDDILATVLRGVFETMGFRRVVLFDVSDGVATRRLERMADGSVAPSADPGALLASETLRSIIDGAQQFALGGTDDDQNPVPDVRGPFCMVPLVSRESVRGVLYAGDRPSALIGEPQLRMLLDFAAQAAMAMENARLYAETRRLLEETKHLAASDPLTGLANRRALDELMDRALHNAERYGGSAALVLLDLDDLKTINDSGGHLAGDEALRALGDVLRSNSRRGDVVARYGGDEFVLFMPQADRSAAHAAVDRLFATLGRRELRCSAGVSIFPHHGNQLTALFQAADGALYEAKQAGKNCFRFAAEPG